MPRCRPRLDNSHYHLDHTCGGTALSLSNVITHEKSPAYWKAVDQEGVLEPTRYISGDTILNIGGVEIQALYLGMSHTDTLYAFHSRVIIRRNNPMFTAFAVDLLDTAAPGFDTVITNRSSVQLCGCCPGFHNTILWLTKADNRNRIEVP